MKKRFFVLLATILLAVYAEAHVNLLNPTGGETYSPGETIKIRWEIVIPHNQQNWDLYYSSDGGDNWDPIQLDLELSVLNYDWVVPSTPTSSGKIRVVQDNLGNNYADISTNFTISSLRFTSPLGGEIFDPQESVEIAWEKSLAITALSWDLLFTLDNGLNWEAIALDLAPNVMEYDWSVPLMPTTSAQIKIILNGATEILENQTGAFTINPVVTLDSPVGGEIFNQEDEVEIAWSSPINLVGYNWELQFSTDNGLTWTTIFNEIPATSLAYQWTVPAMATQQGLIKIVLDGESKDFEAVSSVFTITTHVELTNPTGGEMFEPDEVVAISWDINLFVGMLNWDLFFSTDNGLTWEPIELSLPAHQLTFDWTVPNMPTEQAIIKIVVDNENVYSEDSSDSFTIAIVNGVGDMPVIKSRVYPNPADVSVTIEIDNPTGLPHNLEVLDIRGKKQIVLEQLFSGQAQIDVRKLSSGMYFYVLSNKQSLYVGKFLIK